MNEIINYIKEKQKEYHEGSPAYNVLRALEVELPSLFEPSEHNTPEPLNVKGATAEEILEKHFRRDTANDWTPHILNAMQEYATIQRNEAIQECIELVIERIRNAGRAEQNGGAEYYPL